MDSSHITTPFEIAVNTIVEKHFNLAKKMARAISGSTGILSSDLEGPAMEGLWRGAQALVNQRDNTREPEAYLTVSVKNSILNFVRKEHKHGFTGVTAEDEKQGIPPLISLDVPEGDEEDEYTLEDVLAARDSSSIDELKRDVWESIQKIPSLYRVVFAIKFDEPTITNQEIADKLDVSLDVVENYIREGRKYLNGK